MTRRLPARQRPLNCRAVGKLLQGYLDAEIPATEALRVAAHLEDCRRCGLEADAYRALITAVAKFAQPADEDRLERLRSFAEDLVSTT